MTEVRLMTFNAAILARSVRISSCTPSVKNALSGSRLRFSNGRTAMLFPRGNLESNPDWGTRPLREKNKNPAAAAKQNAAANDAASLGLRCDQRNASTG